MKNTGPNAEKLSKNTAKRKQPKPKLSIQINQLPYDLIKRIFAVLDWKTFGKIAQVSHFWHSLIYQFSKDFSSDYFPYFKYLPDFVKSPVIFLVKERSRYKGDFPERKMLLILAALSKSMAPIDALEEEKEKIKLFSLFLASDNPTLAKNLTADDHAHLQSVSEKDKKIIRICAFKYYACHGQLEVVEKYLSLLPFLKSRNDFNTLEALSGAIKFGHLEMVKLLYSHAEVTPNFIGLALKKAVKYYRYEIVEFFLSLDKTSEVAIALALEVAATKGDVNIVKLLSSYTNCTGFALIIAAENGYHEIVAFLLNTAVYSFIAQGLYKAVINNRYEVMKCILLHGKIMPEDKGLTLVNAAQYGHIEILKLIISLGDIPTEYKGRALINAAQYNHLEIFQFLVLLSEITSEYKSKALTIAIQFGCLEIVQYFLLLGEIIPLSSPTYTPLQEMINHGSSSHKKEKKIKNSNIEKKVSKQFSRCIIS